MPENKSFEYFKQSVGESRFNALKRLGLNIPEIAALTGTTIAFSLGDGQTKKPVSPNARRLAEVVSAYRLLKAAEPEMPEDSVLTLVAIAFDLKTDDEPVYSDRFLSSRLTEPQS